MTRGVEHLLNVPVGHLFVFFGKISITVLGDGAMTTSQGALIPYDWHLLGGAESRRPVMVGIIQIIRYDFHSLSVKIK